MKRKTKPKAGRPPLPKLRVTSQVNGVAITLDARQMLSRLAIQEGRSQVSMMEQLIFSAYERKFGATLAQ